MIKVAGRHRPLIPLPHPRRNRYTPSSSGQDPFRFCAKPAALRENCTSLLCPSSSCAARFAGLVREAIEAGVPLFSYLTARWGRTGSRSVPMRYCGKLLLKIVTHFSVEMCYDSVTFSFLSGFCEFHHLYRRDLSQQPIEFVEKPGRVNGPACFGGPKGAARHTDQIAVGQQLKHFRVAGDVANL